MLVFKLAQVLTVTFIFFFVGTSPSPASSGQCHEISECECIAHGRDLRDGIWDVAIQPGLVVSNLNMVFPLQSADGDLAIDSTCNELVIKYTDGELGPLEWRLERVIHPAGAMEAEDQYINPISADIWEAAKIKTPEIEQLSAANAIYFGERDILYQKMMVRGSMLLVYAGTPGMEDENGDVSITIRVGPIRLGNQDHTIWMITGKAAFAWAGQDHDTWQRQREVCHCNAVEQQIESQLLARNIYSRLQRQSMVDSKFRVGYGEVLEPMGDHTFNPNSEWVSPETAKTTGKTLNWPCVPGDAQHTDVTGQEMFKKEYDDTFRYKSDEQRAFDETNDQPLSPSNVFPAQDSVSSETGSSKPRAGAFVDSATCEMIIVDPSPKPGECARPEIVVEAFVEHERHHQETCFAKNAYADGIRSTLREVVDGTEAASSNISRKTAAQALDQNIHACLSYQGYVQNAMGATQDEIEAYTRSLRIVENHRAKYCVRRTP